MVVSFLGRGPLTYPYGLEAFDQFAGTGKPSCYIVSAERVEAKAVGAAVLPIAAWTHLACTFDATAIRLYVDGALVTTLPTTTPPAMGIPQPELLVGNDNAGDQTFLGNVDDVRVYGRALSETEIVAAMNTPVAP